jgi:acyl-CoA reductase-like NAD-dependent aldehyde dehydrogenase
MKIQSINPATEEVNKEFETLTKDETLEIAKAAHDAFPAWSQRPLQERAELMKKLSAVFRSKKEEYGKLITLEMGKPIGQATYELERCARMADTYADNAEKWLADEPVEFDAKKTYITHQSIGTILGIMPWNFPFTQIMRFAIPTIIAGNTVVLRHSNVVPMCALAAEEALKLAGFPENVFRAIITDHDAVKALVKSKYIAGASLTGSVEAGRMLAAAAGKNLKKYVLELGGSDPFIVLDDADMELTCKGAVKGRLANSGQSCICSKRFIVVKQKADAFVQGFADLMKAQKVGDPLDPKTDVGPLANKQQIEIIERQVKVLVAAGAKVVCGGRRLPGKGYFYEPTVLTNIKAAMVAKEEIFGPVASVIVVKNEEEAIKVANKTMYGLGATVWTTDLERGERVARRIESGMVFINSTTRADPRIPFGGVKNSGIGRELSRYGLLEFTNTKSIVVS